MERSDTVLANGRSEISSTMSSVATRSRSRVLAGNSAEEAMATTVASFDDSYDRVAALAATLAAQHEAFARPTALEGLYDHVAGELTGGAAPACTPPRSHRARLGPRPSSCSTRNGRRCALPVGNRRVEIGRLADRSSARDRSRRDRESRLVADRLRPCRRAGLTTGSGLLTCGAERSSEHAARMLSGSTLRLGSRAFGP